MGGKRNKEEKGGCCRMSNQPSWAKWVKGGEKGQRWEEGEEE